MLSYRYGLAKNSLLLRFSVVRCIATSGVHHVEENQSSVAQRSVKVSES